jgi:hypothetical protein
VVERMNAERYVERVIEGYAESLRHSRRRPDRSRPAHV